LYNNLYNPYIYIVYTLYISVNDFPNNFEKICGMSYNVPAVNRCLGGHIRALRGKDQGWQNVPEQRRGNVPQRSWGAQRNDLAIAEAGPPTGDEA
jgi:hypothetical protein